MEQIKVFLFRSKKAKSREMQRGRSDARDEKMWYTNLLYLSDVYNMFYVDLCNK